MGTKVQLEKFEGTGFHTWQKKVQFHLMREGIWAIVKGDEEKPAGVRASSWEEKDAKAFGTIALALDDNFIHYVYDCKTSHEAWDKLDKQFGPNAKHSKMTLLIEFFKLNQGDKDIAIHVNDLKSLMSQLASIELPISEDYAIAVLLASPNDNFDNLVTTLTNLPKINLEGIIQALQEEERKQKSRFTINHGGAYYSKIGYKGGNKGNMNGPSKFSKTIKKNGKMKCSICKRTNHEDKDCYFNKDNQANLTKDQEGEEPGSSQEANLIQESFDSWAF